jgi:hypothetical protein
MTQHYNLSNERSRRRRRRVMTTAAAVAVTIMLFCLARPTLAYQPSVAALVVPRKSRSRMMLHMSARPPPTSDSSSGNSNNSPPTFFRAAITGPLSALWTAKSHFVLEGLGRPSNPGWTSDRLNRLTDWAAAESPNRPVIAEYDPSAFWLWKKYRGTALALTKTSVLLAMVIGVCIDVWVRTKL